MNMNDPSNNLKRRLDLLDAKVTIDCKRVKASKNTDRAYNNKVLEFLQFCDVSQPDEKNPRVITPLKVFEFLYYCAFRKKKKLIVIRTIWVTDMWYGLNMKNI